MILHQVIILAASELLRKHEAFREIESALSDANIFIFQCEEALTKKTAWSVAERERVRVELSSMKAMVAATVKPNLQDIFDSEKTIDKLISSIDSAHETKAKTFELTKISVHFTRQPSKKNDSAPTSTFRIVIGVVGGLLAVTCCLMILSRLASMRLHGAPLLLLSDKTRFGSKKHKR